MQTAINELAESLTKKDQIIGIKDGIARDWYLKIQKIQNREKELEHETEKIDLEHKIHHLKGLNDNEVSSKEWFEKQLLEEKAEYREFRYNELQQFKDRELGLQSVMREFKDENVQLIAMKRRVNYVRESLNSLVLVSTKVEMRATRRWLKNSEKNCAGQISRSRGFKMQLNPTLC